VPTQKTSQDNLHPDDIVVPALLHLLWNLVFVGDIWHIRPGLTDVRQCSRGPCSPGIRYSNLFIRNSLHQGSNEENSFDADLLGDDHHLLSILLFRQGTQSVSARRSDMRGLERIHHCDGICNLLSHMLRSSSSPRPFSWRLLTLTPEKCTPPQCAPMATACAWPSGR
jgi:hypothetical protein